MRRAALRLFEVAAVTGIVVGVGLLALQALLPVRVAGWSMHPALHPGDLVVVRRGLAPREGQVALIQEYGHGRVLHRVVAVLRDGSLRTQGDANDVADREPVPRNGVQGTLVAVVPVGRLVARWRENRHVGYDVGSIEQHEATTETTTGHTPTDQGRAP